MASDEVRRTYDTVAAAYEEKFGDELRHKPFDRARLDAFARAVTDPVIDVGCGPGQIGAHLRARGRRVIGADLSPGMATLAAERLDGALASDMRLLPIAADAAGGLVAFYSVIHLSRPELTVALREFARVLRPGGRLLVSAHEGEGETRVEEFLGEAVRFEATFFVLDELVDAATTAGLEIIRAECRAPYPSEHPTVRLYLEAQRPATAR